MELILKLTERCNLNCEYCYYFNGKDKSFKEKPALMKAEVFDDLVIFLKRGIKDLSIDRIRVCFHGGEPLLAPKKIFKEYCDILISELKPILKSLAISVQTNGTVIDNEWIAIFKEYSINLGISIDGPKEYHDKFRVTHKNKGSYDKVKSSIDLLNQQNYHYGILTVIDPSRDPVVIFNHFTKEMKAKGFDFLWPDFTHDTTPPYPPEDYGNFMSRILETWLQNNDPSISIRFVNSYLKLMMGQEGLIYGQGKNSSSEYPIFVVRSDGEITPSDELMNTDPDTVLHFSQNIKNTTLKEFFLLPIFQELENSLTSSPEECKKCCWEAVCGGGGLTNRFSKDNRFDNPSIYCKGLKIFYSNMLRHLINSGIEIKQIAQNLCIKGY